MPEENSAEIMQLNEPGGQKVGKIFLAVVETGNDMFWLIPG